MKREGKFMYRKSKIVVFKKHRNVDSYTLTKNDKQLREKIEKIIFKLSLVAQLVKNPLAMQETLVQFLGPKDPLEKGQATHFSILGLPWWFSW